MSYLHDHPIYQEWMMNRHVETGDAGQWPSDEVRAVDLKITFAWDDSDLPYINDVASPLVSDEVLSTVRIPDDIAVVYGVTCPIPGGTIEIVQGERTLCALTGDGIEHGRPIRAITMREGFEWRIKVGPPQARPVQVILHALVMHRRW